jgi:hypothetical protein
MEVKVFRYNSAKDHTNSLFMINGKYQCEGLEDQYQNVKVHGETRIADGIYPIEFRKEGGFHNKYLKRFGSVFHKGMLQICNVLNFRYVLIHIGNSDKDTKACYLPGYSDGRGKNWISGSTEAYKKIYRIIAAALLDGECVTIEFTTLDGE